MDRQRLRCGAATGRDECPEPEKSSLTLAHGARRAAAALEFSLAAPLLIAMLAGASDLGMAEYSRASIAGAVAAGAEYAMLTGSAVLATNVQTMVRSTASVDTANLTVTVTGPTGYCLTGFPVTPSAATVGTTCSDGTTAGSYIVIAATYTVNGLMGGFMDPTRLTVTESATVRVK